MAIDDSTLWDFCRDKGFSEQLMAVAIGQGLARQLRDMRQAKGWTQAEVARRSGIHQPGVARMEQSCANVSIDSLLKVAAAFDVALIVRFTSWGEFIDSLGMYTVPVSSLEDLRLAEQRVAGGRDDD